MKNPLVPEFRNTPASTPPSRGIIAAAENRGHTVRDVARAMRHLLDHLETPLPAMVKRGDSVLVKVNMGCSGARDPERRLTTHPVVAEMIIEALLDCGAIVSYGDDVARAGRHCERIYAATGMAAVQKRTGAKLVDFVAVGAREVRGTLPYPRKYLVTNAYLDADVVINAASCRSHVGIGMSGAIKNMFGCIVGLRKQLIHNLFPAAPKDFGRAIADIYRTIPADLSFLDLTSVAENAGGTLAVQPVGLMLAGTDAVALDTVAAHAIGYGDLSIWPTYFGDLWGMGCSVIDQIGVRGLEWNVFGKSRLEYPAAYPAIKLAAHSRISAVLNNTWLRARPVISEEKCTGCGDCSSRCPVNCIHPSQGGAFRIDHSACVDCGCCLSACETGAAKLAFIGAAKAIRFLANRLPETVDTKAPNAFDPASTR